MGAFYLKVENRRDILSTTLLTRITAYNIQWGSTCKQHIQSLGYDANEWITRIKYVSFMANSTLLLT